MLEDELKLNDDLQKQLNLVEEERKAFKSALYSLQDSIRSVAKAWNDMEQYGLHESFVCG